MRDKSNDLAIHFTQCSVSSACTVTINNIDILQISREKENRILVMERGEGAMEFGNCLMFKRCEHL